MAYVINKYNGEQLVVLEDGTLDTSTSVGLLGRNYTGYGEVQNENFLYLLENFANSIPPSRPLAGQTWYDSRNQTLNVYSGEGWATAGAATVSENAPNTVVGAPSSNPIKGQLWFKPSTLQLFASNGITWNLIGPEALTGYGLTKLEDRIVNDISGNPHPVIIAFVDDTPLAMFSADEFVLGLSTTVDGFTSIKKGITLSSSSEFNGEVNGNATSASSLSTPVKINGVTFDATHDITITANSSNPLISGEYILGSNFTGALAQTWAVDATPNNTIGKVVARDSSGNFAANIITSDLIGDVTGNVTAVTGTSTFNRIEAAEFIGATLTGNAFTATKLKTPRAINGTLFDGSENITISAVGSTLTGNRLADNIVESNLTTLGRIQDLQTGDNGVKIGGADEARLFLDPLNSFIPTIKVSVSGKGLNFELTDPTFAQTKPNIGFLTSVQSLSEGGDAAPSFTKTKGGDVNLGLPTRKWNKVYGTEYFGTAISVDTINPSNGGTSITAAGDFIVTGNFTVQGSVSTINSTIVTIKDHTLVLAQGAVGAIGANDAGLVIDGANATFKYASTGDKWVSNKDIDVGSHYFRGVATSAQYADLAENYQADREYEPGTVLEFGGEFEVTVASDETRRVAGVVSTNPAYLMNSKLTGGNVVALALQGRVPCKVRGKINKGDMLTSSGGGFARPTIDPKIGTIIGKALEDFDGIEGVIEVVVGRV